MANYSRGYKFELQVRDYYLAKGYDVIRAAGSKGAVDLMAWSKDHIIAIQCKKETKSRGLYHDDIQQLQSCARTDNMIKQLWVKRVRRGVTVKFVDEGGVYKEQKLSVAEIKDEIEKGKV